MAELSDEQGLDDLDLFEAELTAAAARTAEAYCWTLPEGYKVTHHPYARKGRKVKGVYPGGRVWSDDSGYVIRHLWITLVGTKP